MVTIIRNLTARPGQTLYCNCEDLLCGHVSGLCRDRAQVLANVNGVELQLCSSCLKMAKKNKPVGTVSANASREEQHARYIDCGPAAWDDRD